MIDTSIYRGLTEVGPLKLGPVSDIFVMADWSPLNTLGEVEFEVQIGEQWFPMTAVVAEGGDNAAILGLDFIESQDVILRLSHGKMIVGSESMELYRESTDKGYQRISLGNTLTTPDRFCKIVEMGVDLGKPASSKEVW